jgi:hypothetical protein
MDPKAVLERADQAISDLHYSEAISALADYWAWRIGGGFEPRNCAMRGSRPNGDAVAQRLATVLADRISMEGF